ncbi:hypothetical protein EJD97_010644, partial [Solanum chilense]
VARSVCRSSGFGSLGDALKACDARVVRSGRRALRSGSLGDTLRVSFFNLREPSWSAQRVTPVAWVAHSGRCASRSICLGGAVRASCLNIREPGLSAQASHYNLWKHKWCAHGFISQDPLPLVAHIGHCAQHEARQAPGAWVMCSRHCASSSLSLGGTLRASRLKLRGLGP